MLIPTRDRRLSRRTVLAFGAAVLAASLSVSTAAFALSPQEKQVATVANNVISLANSGRRGTSLRKDVASLLVRYSDMNGIARFALGRYRAKLPKAMQRDYNRAVLNYVAGLFVFYADDFVGSGVKIKASRQSGKFVMVDSAVRMAGGSNTPMRWRLRINDSRPKIADINFRGIWLSLRLRDEFVSVLNKNKGDFGALLIHLQTNS